MNALRRIAAFACCSEGRLLPPAAADRAIYSARGGKEFRERCSCFTHRLMQIARSLVLYLVYFNEIALVLNETIYLVETCATQL